MAVKKYNKVVLKSTFFIPIQTKPEKGIDEIIKEIESLGGKSEVASTKAVDEIA